MEKEMVRGLSVLERLSFELADDHLISGSGMRRREVYLLRLHPKNMDILSLQERLGEYTQLQSLLDGDVTMRNAALFNFMSWIWNRVVTRRERMAFFIDEMYLFLNPIVVEWLRNFAKRARKYGAHMFQTTQNLADFNDPEILHMTKPLFELSLHKFDVDRTVMQKLLSLTDGEMDVISVSRQRHCLYKCADEKYHLIVGPLPYEQELFGSAGG